MITAKDSLSTADLIRIVLTGKLSQLLLSYEEELGFTWRLIDVLSIQFF